MNGSYKREQDVDMELDTQRESERSSLDMDLGRRLSQLSNNAKFAMTLNQINRVQICAAYDSEQDGGATMYVVDVFLQNIQKGLPMFIAGETESDRKKRLRLALAKEPPDYQVEHRYSEFRTLLTRIADVVNDHDHIRFCAYCSRVNMIASAISFPPRVLNRGILATTTGWHRLLTHIRKHQLELFVNHLLKAAKDMSYRSGSGQCGRFVKVSRTLNCFLAQPQVDDCTSQSQPSRGLHA
ncbi:hypothetical protein BBJ28_00013027 [Nothophytophthora sp. Chile5]|nr:hypothetical protein BBJ28_00013027 [Nothophytophthora sp. Chile5]